MFVDPHGMSVYAFGGGGGVHMIVNPDAAKHLQDIFVLDAPGPRSAYFIPKLHANMLHPVQASDILTENSEEIAMRVSAVADYGGYELRTMNASMRGGAPVESPAAYPDAAAKHRHGFPTQSPLHIRSLQQRSSVNTSQWKIGDSVLMHRTATSTGSDSLGDEAFSGSFLGYIDPVTGKVFTSEYDVPISVTVVPLLVNPTELRVQGAPVVPWACVAGCAFDRVHAVQVLACHALWIAVPSPVLLAAVRSMTTVMMCCTPLMLMMAALVTTR